MKKSLPLQKNSKFKQGIFPKQTKYYGNHQPIYRSSYEYKFMVLLEKNPNVLKWSSEEIIIPYIMKEKKNGKVVDVRHNYHTDFTVYMNDGKRYLIEVKPLNQTPLNESQILNNPVMYKNACKWKAAINWCKANNFEFKIMTEKQLNIK